jgi:lysophospholipase L1-like esterase
VKAPLICYGSSVLQGTGVEHPSKTYPAVLARRLNLDFVNLGFGGAGKAEPDVVALVNRPEASAFLFDLGKSYGDQTPAPFARMLADIRATHPTVPIVCVTPIFSTKEDSEKGYREKSEHLRSLMRDAALERRRGGDRHIFVVEGLELFGPADQSLFHDPLHPNDAGNERMGERLVDLIRSAVLERGSP